jgi:hypothetical protein
LAGRGSAIAAGAAARAPAGSRGGLGGASFGAASPSPLLASYQQWSMGRPVAAALPRNPSVFTDGAFAPLMPLTPTPVDNPPPGSDRPEPRRWQYPVGWNLPVGQPGTEGLKLCDFATLRLYSDLYSIARACIQLRKDEITGLEWSIIATPTGAKALRGKAAAREFGERQAKLTKFFSRPDSDYHDFGSWMSAVLEDIFVVDALSLYVAPPRLSGHGVLGSGRLAELQLIDGTIVRPLVDVRGQVPRAPNPAYQVYNYGVPRVDLMTMIRGEDAADMDAPVREYRGDQLLYLRRWPRRWTVYGQSPLERVIIPAMAHLRKQQYQLDFFTEGSIPGMFVMPGDPSITPNQCRELQENLNVLAGDQAWKHRLLVLPPGTKVAPQKPPALAGEDDTVLMTEVCMGYSVMPTELGIIPQFGPSVSSSSIRMFSESSRGIHQRKATIPDLKFLSSIFNMVIQVILGQDDMMWHWEGIEDSADAAAVNDDLVNQLEHGGLSIDEFRQENGHDPWGLPLTREPVWATSSGLVPLGALGGGGSTGNQADGALVESQLAGYARPGPGQPVPSVRPPQPVQQAPGNAVADGARRAAKQAFTRPAAAAAEIASLRRHLRKGRDPASWEPRWLPDPMMRTVVSAAREGYRDAADEYLGRWEQRARELAEGHDVAA